MSSTNMPQYIVVLTNYLKINPKKNLRSQGEHYRGRSAPKAVKKDLLGERKTGLKITAGIY